MSERPRPRRLRLAVVRRAATAPDLERYLSRKRIDLAFVDQVDAVRVRMRRGVEVFEKRIEEGTRKARSQLVIYVLLGLFFGPPACAPAVMGLGAIPLALSGAFFMLIDATLCTSAARDLAQLRRLRGTYWRPLEDARSIDDLLRFADSVLEDARTLGVLVETDEE